MKALPLDTYVGMHNLELVVAADGRELKVHDLPQGKTVFLKPGQQFSLQISNKAQFTGTKGMVEALVWVDAKNTLDPLEKVPTLDSKKRWAIYAGQTLPVHGWQIEKG